MQILGEHRRTIDKERTKSMKTSLTKWKRFDIWRRSKNDFPFEMCNAHLIADCNFND